MLANTVSDGGREEGGREGGRKGEREGEREDGALLLFLIFFQVHYLLLIMRKNSFQLKLLN